MRGPRRTNHRFSLSLTCMALAALVVAPLAPAGAVDPPLEWGPPILTESTTRTHVVAGPGGFVSIEPHPVESVDAPLQTSTFYSVDGFTWQPGPTISMARLVGLTAGGPGFVAVGSKRLDGDLLAPAVWVSTSGQSWSEVQGVPSAVAASLAESPISLATVDPIPFRGSWMTDVAADGSELIAVGRNSGSRGAQWSSTDGTSWTVTGAPFGDSTAEPSMVASGTPGWMVLTRQPSVGDDPGPVFTWWSADGVTWHPAADDESFGAGTGRGPFTRRLLGFADGFVMLGMHDIAAAAWVSADGRAWSPPHLLPTRPETDSAFVLDAATDESLLIAVGDDVVFADGTGPATSEAAIWASTDGAEWLQVDPASLRGPVTLHGVDADVVYPVHSWWVVLGSTSDPGVDPLRIAWIGKPVGSGHFADVPAEHPFFGDVEWLAASGVTRGCNPPANTLYCPEADVTRGQAAAFLVRAFGYADDGGGDLVVDDDDSIFEADIDKLRTAGVTRGCNPPANTMYCPDADMTRGQAAALLVRAFGYADDGGGDLFVDDDDSIFEADIDKLRTAGVTRGCNPPANTMYCSDADVTRAQLAAFLRRAFD